MTNTYTVEFNILDDNHMVVYTDYTNMLIRQTAYDTPYDRALEFLDATLKMSNYPAGAAMFDITDVYLFEETA